MKALQKRVKMKKKVNNMKKLFGLEFEVNITADDYIYKNLGKIVDKVIKKINIDKKEEKGE